MKKMILTIAGSDTLAGGGLQSDLKTFENYQLFGLTAITCIAVVKDHQFEIKDLPAEVISEQLDTIRETIKLDGIKIGLIHSLEGIELVREFLTHYKVPIVLDPVLAFKETDQTYNQTYKDALVEKLFPLAEVVTPNLKEAEILSEMKITTIAEMKQAAQKILLLGPKAVVIKGGERLSGTLASDLYYDGEQFELFSKPKLAKPTINGAGCTFASSIAANLVQGKPLIEAIAKSKAFVYHAIENGVYLNAAEGNVWYGGIAGREEDV